MSSSKSAEEVKEEHLEAFGEPLGSVYYALYNEVAWLHQKWQEYRKLYGTSKERIELLSETAPSFFHVLQQVLWRDVLLHLARLTDPPKQREFENLTLLRLPEAVEDAQLRSDVCNLVEDVKVKTNFARTWRNKRIAHSDLPLALNAESEQLPGVSRANVEEALSSIRSVMNSFSNEYLGSTTAFEHVIPAPGDADALVHYLNDARWREKRRREQALEGQWSREDFELPPRI